MVVLHATQGSRFRRQSMLYTVMILSNAPRLLVRLSEQLGNNTTDYRVISRRMTLNAVDKTILNYTWGVGDWWWIFKVVTCHGASGYLSSATREIRHSESLRLLCQIPTRNYHCNPIHGLVNMSGATPPTSKTRQTCSSYPDFGTFIRNGTPKESGKCRTSKLRFLAGAGMVRF